MKEYTLTVEEYFENDRIDRYVCDALADFSRSYIQKLIGSGDVTADGRSVKSSYRVKTGDRIRVITPDSVIPDIIAEDIPLDILYEDDDVLVVNKPKGMVVHPAPGNPDGTLVNALLYHFKNLSSIGGAIRPGIVHRIDRDTSGLLVVAKNDFAHEKLAVQFAEHTARRSYVCLVHGNFKEDSGTIDAPIGRHPVDRKRMAVVKDGRRAVTHWSVLERYGDATFLHVELETGRTHQIRVHMAYAKHPILGDAVYGSTAPQLGLYSQTLHGYRLTFVHPRTEERMTFTAPLPEDFLTALKRLSNNGTMPEWVTKGEQ